MKPKIDEGQMLRIRLECLKLAVTYNPSVMLPGYHDKLETVANALLRYVLTGSMVEQAAPQQQYRPVEMTDAKDLP